jgi:hypothetical protein
MKRHIFVLDMFVLYGYDYLLVTFCRLPWAGELDVHDVVV